MSDKKIEIVTTVASLIEPGKKYIIWVNNQDLTQNDAAQINDQIHEWGADSVTVILRGSNHPLVVELEGETPSVI